MKLESVRPTAADSRTVGRLHCFFVLFSILLDADASVSPGTHYLQLGYSTHWIQVTLKIGNKRIKLSSEATVWRQPHFQVIAARKSALM